MSEFFSNPGEQFRTVYTPDVGKDGQIDLVPTGKEDIQQYIDSFKDSCDVNLMVQRFVAGDETALRNGNPVFMDLLGAPKTLAEAYSLNFRAQAAFDNLPAEIKNKFGNNFYQFLYDAGSPEWFEALKTDPVPGSIVKDTKEVSADAE